jgi:hypothetical protein
MSTLKHRLRAEVNVSVDGHQEMAGFEVSINGRSWVSTEGIASGIENQLSCVILAVQISGLP